MYLLMITLIASIVMISVVHESHKNTTVGEAHTVLSNTDAQSANNQTNTTFSGIDANIRDIHKISHQDINPD